MFKELQAFVNFSQRFDGINWKVFVRLMNRHRKTGTYIKQDLAEAAAGSLGLDFRGGLDGLFAPTDVEPVEDGGYGDEDYEGGEAEEAFPDIETELSK